MISFICKYCNNNFEFKKVGQCGGHVSNCKDNPNRNVRNERIKLSNKKFHENNIQNKQKEYYSIPNICLNCNTPLNYEKRNNKFCNKSCSAQYNNCKRLPRSNESKLRTSVSIKNSIKFQEACCNSEFGKKVWKIRRENLEKSGMGSLKTDIIFKECTWCKNIFVTPTKNYSYKKSTRICSDECYIQIKRLNFCGTTSYYKGIAMDSKWEIELAEWLDKNNIKWIRPKSILWIDKNGIQRKYFPDFYLLDYNLYLDPKHNMLIQSQKEKLDIVEKQINLKYGNVEKLKQFIKTTIKDR